MSLLIPGKARLPAYPQNTWQLLYLASQDNSRGVRGGGSGLCIDVCVSKCFNSRWNKKNSTRKSNLDNYTSIFKSWDVARVWKAERKTRGVSPGIGFPARADVSVALTDWPKVTPLSEFICLSILALTFSQLFPRAARFSCVDRRDDWRHYRAAPTAPQPKQSTHNERTLSKVNDNRARTRAQAMDMHSDDETTSQARLA